MNARERQIQIECENELIADGWRTYRTQRVGRRGWPDTTAHKLGHVLYIEFKDPDTGVLSPHQVETIEEFRRAGINIVVATSWADVAPFTQLST